MIYCTGAPTTSRAAILNVIAAVGKSIPVLLGVVFLLIITLAGILAPVIAPHDPLQGTLRERNVSPAWLEGGSTEHLLGTDHLGRDVFSRVTHGARVTLMVSLASLLVAVLIGGSLGLMAGYFGGRADALDMRLADLPLILFALLPVLLALFLVHPTMVLVILIGPSLPLLVILTAVVPGLIFAHQVWRETLGIKKGDTIPGAGKSDVSPFRSIIRHVSPKVVNSLAVLGPPLMVYAIVLEGALSIVGAGVPPPTPAWGSMVAEGRDRLAVAWWISTIPGLAILLTVFFLTLLADQFRSQFGPRPGAE